MKGIIFTEMLAMAEDEIGERRVDHILDQLNLDSGGAYTSVGNYPCSELMQLVEAYGDHTGCPVGELQRALGYYTLMRFTDSYAEFFSGKADALAMLESIENDVHAVEVRKLYPDAEVPSLAAERLSPKSLRLTYRSPRPLADFCQGLIEACVEHFGTPGQLTRRDIPTPGEIVAEFTITLNG